MRQKQVSKVVILVTAGIIAAIAGFAIIRQTGTPAQPANEKQQHQDQDTSSHQHETTQDHEDPSTSHAAPSGVLKNGQRVITMKAHQFEFEPDHIVVLKGETVKLNVTSTDVTHGIQIDEYNINRELKPNQTQEITFTPDETGTFHFHCSVYCGQGHSQMHGEVNVIESK